jgi:outer membrane protein OmpA-like peptidoglycan-associated protein
MKQRLQIDRQAAPSLGTPIPAPAPGVATPASAPLIPARAYRKQLLSPGPRFDMQGDIRHDPPDVDELLVTHRVKFDFRDLSGDRISQWDPAWRPSAQDLAAGRWLEAEKEAFRQQFFRTISADWSGKHQFRLTHPDYLAHLCTLRVRVAADDRQPHSTVTVHKRLPHNKRIRSFVNNVDPAVQGANSALLDSRDNDTEDNQRRRFVLVQPFPHNSADVSSLGPALDVAAAKIKRRTRTPPATEEDGLRIIGFTSIGGTHRRNSELQQQRAAAVRQAVGQRLGWSTIGHAGGMDEAAGSAPKFRRVEIHLPDLMARQRTSSHEFGHLIGLGDEYEEGAREASDPSTHFEDVKKEMSPEAADEMRVVDDDDIMSIGSEVRRGHYLPFLQTLKNATGLPWEVL